MIKACFISDTHLRDIDLPEADILFHCGDYLMKGDYYEWVENVSWLKRERPKFKYWVTTMGNHDIYVAKNAHTVGKYLAEELGIDFLLNSSIERLGLNIYGSPCVPWISGRWVWEYSSTQIEEQWVKIPEGLDILLTHGPPFGILDKSIRPSGELSRSFGCPSLREKLIGGMDSPPKIHAFGHIHKAPEQDKVYSNYGITKFINCALLDDHYKQVNDPIVMDI